MPGVVSRPVHRARPSVRGRLWGREGRVISVRRVGRACWPHSRAPVPLISEELFLFLSFCYLAFRCVLQLVVLRPRSTGLQGARDRRATARAGGTSPADGPAAADDDRSCLLGCGESAVAALALAVVSGHADDAAALAPAARRPPLDLRRSVRSAADRWRDPRAGAPRSWRGRIRAGVYPRIVGELLKLGLWWSRQAPSGGCSSASGGLRPCCGAQGRAGGSPRQQASSTLACDLLHCRDAHAPPLLRAFLHRAR